MSTVRTRFAPAPSGDLHVGNVRTALFSWAFARHHGGAFILRAEDTDASRATDEAYESLQRDLRWLGLDWDEGPVVGGPHAPYRQSERGAIYREAVERLLASGAAYRAFDTPEDLEQARAAAAATKQPYRYDGTRWRELDAAESQRRAEAGETYLIRFAMPPGITRFVDLVRGEVTVDHHEIGDFGLMRADGSPMYYLAATVDDVLMGLTHIVRGDDLLMATPRQMAIYAALGHPEDRWPVFAHVPQVTGGDGKPLSKRNGEVSLAAYRLGGIVPEAMLNYLATLGWSMPDGSEVFTADAFVAEFGLDRVQRSPAQFDVKKLEVVNGEWLRRLPLPELGARVDQVLAEAGVQVDLERLEAALPELASRLRRLTDAPALLAPLFGPPEAADEAALTVLASPDAGPVLDASAEVLAGLGEWNPDAIIDALRPALIEGLGIKPKLAFAPLYVAMTGRRQGFPVNHTMALVGRQETLARIGRARAAVGS
jgi:glutamyl-tRNA synthetase